MKKHLLVFLAFIFCLSCTEEIDPQKTVTASGTVVKIEVSSFMYGTHLLVQGEDSIVFALKSTAINLDNYLHQEVTVSGKTVAGYPVDGGPVYVDVTRMDLSKSKPNTHNPGQ